MLPNLTHDANLTGAPMQNKMYERFKKSFCFPQESVDVSITVLRCPPYSRYRLQLRKFTTPIPLLPSREPLLSVGVYVLESLPLSGSGRRFSLVVTDCFKKLTPAIPFRKIDSYTVACAFVKYLIFNTGPQICGRRKWNIFRVGSLPPGFQADGYCELFHEHLSPLYQEPYLTLQKDHPRGSTILRWYHATILPCYHAIILRKGSPSGLRRVRPCAHLCQQWNPFFYWSLLVRASSPKNSKKPLRVRRYLGSSPEALVREGDWVLRIAATLASSRAYFTKTQVGYNKYFQRSMRRSNASIQVG